jgi:hypothetical protein
MKDMKAVGIFKESSFDGTYFLPPPLRQLPFLTHSPSFNLVLTQFEAHPVWYRHSISVNYHNFILCDNTPGEELTTLDQLMGPEDKLPSIDECNAMFLETAKIVFPLLGSPMVTVKTTYRQHLLHTVPWFAHLAAAAQDLLVDNSVSFFMI